VNGAFKRFKLLVGNFHNPEEYNKGLFNQLSDPTIDIAWLISSNARAWYNRDRNLKLAHWKRLADTCEKFHNSGRGLFIWAGNEPFFAHANVVLERLFKVGLEGNEPGELTLERVDADLPDQKQFISRPNMILTSGLKCLYEGKTISYCLKFPADCPLKYIAKSSGGNPIILYSDYQPKVGYTCGRVVVDTGFTKLWKEWSSVGTERFVCNASRRSGYLVWNIG